MLTLAVAAGAAAGAAFGAVPAPALASRVLARKRAALKGYMRESIADYREFVSSHGRDPERGAKGAEGALGIWLSDARRQLGNGNLTREEALELGDCGAVSMEAAERYAAQEGRRSESDVDERYGAEPRPSERILLSFFCLAGFSTAVYGACGGLL